MNALSTFSAAAGACLRALTRLVPGAILTLVALPIVVVVAIHCVELARGKSAWDACRAQSEARGVEFSLEKLLPPSDVPDAENFAKLPLIAAGVLAKRGDGAWPTELDLPGRAAAVLSSDGAPLDLAAFRKELTAVGWIAPDDSVSDAEACLHALARFDPPLQQLRAGLERRYARYERNLQHPEETGVPPFLILRKAGQILRFRFEAHAASGQLDEACEDFEFALRMARTLDQSPVLVGAMIQTALTYLATQGLEPWLQQVPWSEAQLARLAEAIGELYPLRSVAKASAVERAIFNQIGLRLATGEMDPVQALSFVPHDASPEKLADKARRLALRLYPRGWHYQSLVWAAPVFDENETHLDPIAHRWHPSHVDPEERFRMGGFARLRHAYAFIAFANFHRAQLRTVAVQAELDLTHVALALERHRLATGAYPARLAELENAAFALPCDLTDGEPLRYHPTSDGRYLLYALAFNGRDDGGSSENDPAPGGIGAEFDRLDWVWGSRRPR